MRPDLPIAPPGIQALPCDVRGFPIPWFVHIDEAGTPHFPVMGHNKVRDAVRHGRCWICGGKLGRIKAFVIGPMCAVNRISAEPPSHPLCAEYAARACPFLTRPLAKRAPVTPGQYAPPPGEMIERNPGVTLVWWTLRYELFKVDNGALFKIGAPHRTLWFAHGRLASRDEVLESIDSGLPILRDMAESESPEALAHFHKCHAEALQLLPAA